MRTSCSEIIRLSFGFRAFQRRDCPVSLEVSRSHVINAWTSRKRQHLQNEKLESQPNHHFPPFSVAASLWFSCHKTIYKITSSDGPSAPGTRRETRSCAPSRSADGSPLQVRPSQVESREQ